MENPNHIDEILNRPIFPGMDEYLKRKQKRYDICLFPSLFGTPWTTNLYGMAVIYAIIRKTYDVLTLGFREVRVDDNANDNSIIVW
jgi:hypothetical protein